MKIQILILSLCVAMAVALPVPDEEVSLPEKATIGEIKADEAPKPKEIINEAAAPLDAKVSTAVKKVEELPLAKPAAAAAVEEKPILPLGAPDAELAQAAAEPKPELKEKEKNIRAENQAVVETKSLPAGLIETPAVPAAAAENQQQIVEEQSPSVQSLIPESKSADLSAAASAPIAAEIKPAETIISASADAVPAIAETVELKKEVTTPRQERGEEQAAAAAEHVQVIQEVPAIAPEAVKEEIPAVKSLAAEKPLEVVAPAPVAETIIAEQAEQKIGDLKTESSAKPEQKLDILPVGQEAEQKDGPAAEIKPLTQPQLQKEDGAVAPAAIPAYEKPLKNSSEEKDSVESKESSESADKSSDEDKSN